nr:hypothetical protein [Tanacetum cinerariifolium]
KLNQLSGSGKVNMFNAVIWIRNIVIKKRVEDLQLGIESYQTKLNLTKLNWDASDFLFKEDYTIVSKPWAVIYRDRNYQKKMIRETKVHKFSDGTHGKKNLVCSHGRRLGWTDHGQSHVALAGSDPEPMHDDFVATVYPQFFNDKPTEKGSGKTNMETEVESMVTVMIHRAFSLVPSLSMPVIDLTPPKPVSSTTQAPIFTATTETTTTLPPPPPQQQSTTDPALASCVSTLEMLRDLPHKIDQTVNKAVKEAVQTALQALLRERFKDLSESDMKEILHDWRFKSGTYSSHPKHVALYEALEASMDRDNRDEFLDVIAKSRNKCREDQDPPPPPDLDQGKKKRKSKLSKADLEGPAYKVVIAFHSNSNSVQFHMKECHLLLIDQIDLVNPKGHQVIPDMSKPLPLGGPPGQKKCSISKLKAANYLDFGLEELISSLWIESEQEYDISKLNQLSGSGKVNMFNAVIWIRNIVIKKRVEDLQLGIESYQTKLNLTKLNWDASDFLFKEDYTIVSKPWAVIYRDRNYQKKMIRETKVHKFSDGTLTRILEKLDHMVKDFKLFKYNPGMEKRIW